MDRGEAFVFGWGPAIEWFWFFEQCSMGMQIWTVLATLGKSQLRAIKGKKAEIKHQNNPHVRHMLPHLLTYSLQSALPLPIKP